MKNWIIALLIVLVAAGGADGRSHKRSRKGGGSSSTPGQFDYYLLSLSWAPDFCDLKGSARSSRECATGNHVGFIVHGLWPQFERGGYPKQCAPASPVASDIVTRMLPLMMDAGLVQHEWADHGTCSGLDTSTYFDTVRKAAAAVTIPSDYKNLNQAIQVSPGDVDGKFAAANTSFPQNTFRTACGSGEISEVHVCLTKDLKPRACAVDVQDCSAGQQRMLPLR